MTDLLIPYLISMSVSLFLLGATAFLLFELRRRIETFKERESRLPDACRLPGLTEEVSRLTEERNAFQKDIDDARALLARKESSEQWLEKNLVTYERASSELPALRAEVDSLEQQATTLRGESFEIKGECEVLRKEYHDVHQSLAPARVLIERQKQAQEWLDDNLAQYERIKLELPRCESDMLAARTERDTAIQEQKHLVKEALQLQYEIAPARLVIAQKDAAETWLSENLPTYEQARRELPGLQTELQSLKEQRDATAVEVDELRAEARQINQDTAPFRLIIAQKREAEKWLNENRELYEQAKRELPKLTTMIDSLRATLSETRKESDALQAEVNNAEQKRKWLSDECERLSETLERQQADHDRLRSEADVLQARQAGLLIQIEEQSARRDGLETQLRSVESELPRAKQELERVQREHIEIKAEWETKFAELGGMKKQLQDVNRLLEAAEKRWTQIAPTVGVSDEDRLAELWKPAIARKAFTTPAKDDEQASLNRTSNYLEQLGIQFHERVLHAFHTSLKVAEMSPLVVLAGISGTGKSELPRRYAEGMGLHFLSLAVQPRWDSPQDMFGFFNFLENRYRATELGRALVQMDRFFDAPERGWTFPKEWRDENLCNRMLLVLLDEMNLARVEYYFSEFLSRLEIRRGIASENPHERRKAEIALEVGLQSLKRENGQVQVQQQPTLQLFVDRNVLFVGTMNEDETTQTLSDKVVDRANVLRFGRPFKLRPGAVQNPPKPTEKWLPYESWKSWTRDSEKLDSHIRGEVSGWIQELNQAMQSIGRPFAHRTFASMLAYIANYPDPSAYKLAMADQVEQKLLPKFRGLDPQDSASRQALGTIQAILGKLGDEPLLEAVRQSQKQSEHQFSWLGVDRLGAT